MESVSEIKFPESVSSERSQLLTVLCTLSFIMACIMIILSALKTMDTANSTATYVMIVLESASLFAVIMMWQLKKMGFFIYVIAEILPWVLLFSFGGTVYLPSQVSNSPYLILGSAMLIDLVLILLYLRTFKEMK